jgi:hypothetical protein
LRQVPLRTMVKLPHSGQASPISLPRPGRA